MGAGLAIVVWILASLGFGIYVANFGAYNKTYGSLAGVIILLLWLWLTNMALLFGAEVDAEIERSRQLQAGIEAEESLQLPPRDTRRSEKEALKLEAQIEEGRELHERATARCRLNRCGSERIELRIRQCRALAQTNDGRVAVDARWADPWHEPCRDRHGRPPTTAATQVPNTLFARRHRPVDGPTHARALTGGSRLERAQRTLKADVLQAVWRCPRRPRPMRSAR